MNKLKLLFSIFWCILLNAIDTSCANRLLKLCHPLHNLIAIQQLKNVAYYINPIQKYFDIKNCNKITDDLSTKDPELYAVFLQMQKDFGITEPISLRVMKSGNNQYDMQRLIKILANYNCREYKFSSQFSYIRLAENYKTWSKPFIIHTLAHELEHHRQLFKYPGSYHHNPKDPGNGLKLECGADAAAAGYQHCYLCLKDLPGEPNKESDTPYGFFSSKYGYFTKKDYLLYADQAEKDKAQCPAHKAGTHNDPNTSLKDFLPPKYF